MSEFFYASGLSPFGARLRLAARFKGLDFNFVPPPGGSGSAEYKLITPFGRIPAIDADGQVVPESLALLEYLEDAYPDAPSLLPTSPILRARARAIALLFDHNVVKALTGVFQQLARPIPDADVARAALDDVATEIGKLVHFFDPEGPAVGGAISIADCALVPFAYLIDRLSGPFGAISPTQRAPRFAQWWGEVSVLPEVVAVTDGMGAALAAMMAARKAQAAGSGQ